MSVILETARTLEKIIEQIPGARVEWPKPENKNGQTIIQVTDKNNSVFVIEVRTQ